MGNTVKKIALEAYPKDRCTEDSWIEYPVKKGYDLNEKNRECFREGFEKCLKVLHAWACGKYNEAEDSGDKDRMKSFREMKRQIMSMCK